MPLAGVVSDLQKLLDQQTLEPAVVSLYLAVPKDPEALRGLSARAAELLGTAAGNGAGRVRDEDLQTVRQTLEQHGRDWLGHTVALFVSRELRLREAFPLPCGVPDRAVLGVRPHVRPLLVSSQRCPVHLVVIIDRQHARLFRVRGEEIDTVAEAATEGVRSAGFGGWWGWESHRVNERVNQLARHHFRETAAMVEQELRRDPKALAVIGGHEQTIPQLVAMLPNGLRDRVAGSFIADPHTLTPDRARGLARPVVDHWVQAREQRLVADFLEVPPGRGTALGLAACLTAVNQHAVQELLVPVGGMIPGYVCGRCGALSSDGTGCPHGPQSAAPTPDLIEEMAVATIADGGEVNAVRDPPGEVAARLRFPPAQPES